MDIADDFFILFRQFVYGINDKYGHITVIDSTDGSNYTVFFERFIYFAFSAHPCGIHEDKSLPFIFPYGIHSVPGSTHLISYQRTFISKQGIDKGGFPHIWTTYNGSTDDIF